MATIDIGGRPVDIADAAAPFDRSSTLPRQFYLDPDLYELEVQRVFASNWLPVARVEQIAEPGSFLAVELCGEQLVLARDGAGSLRVLSNVCRHRAMPLVEGRGRGKAMQCPYHLWSYRLDGSLSGAPLMDQTRDFDRGKVRLPEFRHEVWQGWVMVNLDGTAPPLAGQVDALEESIKPWVFEDMRIVASAVYQADWNWKVTFENFSEYYHHLGLHRDSLEPFLPAKAGQPLDSKGEPWHSSWVSCSEDYLFLQGAPMPRLPAEQASAMQIFSLFPILCAGGQPASGFWLQILPQTVDRHTVTWHIMLRPEQAEARGVDDFVESSLKAIELIQEEDAASCRGVQRGLRSSKAAPGRFAQLERPLWEAQLWLLSGLADDEGTVHALAGSEGPLESKRR